MEFSWPVATETVDPTDFEFTLNTGETVFGHAAGLNPNWELNERNTVVPFGDFGNRIGSAEPGAEFPVKLEIVPDETPLMLIGPDGREVSAVGLTWTTETSPYDVGPRLVGAKLNSVGTGPVGEGGVTMMERAGGAMPNDEFSLYEEGDFRLRVLTSGGFSPDGVTGVRPDMFEDFFRLEATGPDGETVVMDRVGVDYQVKGGTLRVVGLSDLGKAEDPEGGSITTTATWRTATTTSTSSWSARRPPPARSPSSTSHRWTAGTAPSTTRGTRPRAVRRDPVRGAGAPRSGARRDRAGRPDAGQQGCGDGPSTMAPLRGRDPAPRGHRVDRSRRQETAGARSGRLIIGSYS